MPDDDEYDALLEEPFGEDIDWREIDGMAGHAAATSDSDEYFNDDELLDESFLDEVRRLEDQVVASIPGANALPPASTPVASPTSSFSRPFQQNPPPNTGESSSVAVASFQNLAPSVERSTMTLGPRSPQSTLSATHVILPPSTSSVLTPNGTQTGHSLDPTLISGVDSPPSAPTPPKRSCQASSPRKRHRTSSCSSDALPSCPKAQRKANQKVSKRLEAIEKALECPICFDTIAASHVFACGHSACGLCLCEWVRVKGDNTTCCVCRAPHKGPLLANYTLDDVATAYFNEKGNIGPDKRDCSDKMRWEKRKAEGKSAVRAAAQKQVKRLDTGLITVGPTYRYDPEEDVSEGDFYDHDVEYDSIGLPVLYV